VGDCQFLTSAGFLNIGLATGFGNGLLGVVGPINGGVPNPNILASINNIVAPNAGVGAGFIQLTNIALAAIPGAPSAITVPGGENLVMFIHDNPFSNDPANPGNNQYWTWSTDERNLCSAGSASFVLTTTAAGTAGAHFFGDNELGWDFGTLDATMTATVMSNGGGPLGNNAWAGLAAPFDAGSGHRTISITGANPTFGAPLNPPLGSDSLGFNTYDEDHPLGGSARLVFVNAAGFNALCFNQGIQLPTGGPGPDAGPGSLVIGSLIPQQTRIVGKWDSLTAALIGNPIWLGGTGHDTTVGGTNIPFFPAAALVGGSTGNTGGFQIPLPPLPTPLAFSCSSARSRLMVRMALAQPPLSRLTRLTVTRPQTVTRLRSIRNRLS
jgi:hypothetical protein